MKYLDCISVGNMRKSDRMTIDNYVSGRTLMMTVSPRPIIW